jgi:hypothetical protein
MSEIDEYIGKNEKILGAFQRHWINVLPLMVAWTVLALAALYGFYLLGRYHDDIAISGSVAMVGVGLAAVLLLAILLAYASWYVYAENRIILTDQNLYQITQNSLFSKKVGQFSLERLQDVSASQSGFIATTLDYGDVIIETAGEEENFVFHQAPRPREVATEIMDCHKRAVESSGSSGQV